MIENSYLLDVDLKRPTSTTTPVFRRGDTAVLKFRVHDDGDNENFKTFDRAELTITMPSGLTLVETCTKESINGVDIAKALFQKIHTIEVGIYSVALTLFKGEDQVSPPPIAVEFSDNTNSSNYEFIEIMNELQEELDRIKSEINKGIPLSQINIPSGVAGLDSYSKIPPQFLPDYFDLHMQTSMHKDGAHGFKIENKKPYVLINGSWVECFFSEDPMDGGGKHTPPTVTIDNGNVTIVFPEEPLIILRKWDKGIRDVAYFADKGNVIQTNKFTVTEIGNYTFYYKLASGKEFVVVFQVREEDLLPDTRTPIKDIPNESIVRFGGLEWIVLNNAKGMLITKGPVSEMPFDLSTGESIFKSTDANNVAYWLNNDFTDIFTMSEKSSILVHKWNTASETNEKLTTDDAQVGLLSYIDADEYKGTLAKYPLLNSTGGNNQGYMTLTGDSADRKSIWVVVDTPSSISINAYSKSLDSKVRPVIYLEENTKLDIITEDEIYPINQFKDGDIVKFSNMKWKIVDKNKKLLMYCDDSIYRSFKDVRSWLNSRFIYSLSTQAQSFIKNTEYNVQEENLQGTSVEEKLETTYVTIPSLEMWDSYKDSTMSHLKKTQLIFSSLYIASQGEQCALINPEVLDGVTESYIKTSIENHELVIPIITLKDNATVGLYDVTSLNIEDCKFGDQIFFSGYTWRVASNNRIILESRFKHDEYNQIDTFTNEINDKGFVYSSSNTNNIGYRANNTFLLSNMYVKNISDVIPMPLETGIVENESSAIGTFNVGLVSNKEWSNNFSFTLFQSLGLTEDFWLLNWGTSNRAQYVNALTGAIVSANPLTTKKLFKPVVTLKPGTKVDKYALVDSMYAYIPDPIVRGQLNLNLGKGSANNPSISQITLEEMQSITFFDSLELIKATDLTGLELLTNCSEIRMAHNRNLPFNITNFSPLSKLGEGKTLRKINIYGVPEGDTSLTVYNQLKGKFPDILGGGVFTTAYDKVLISTAELKGIAEDIYLPEKNLMILYAINSDDFHDGYAFYAKVYAWGKSPFTHVKGFTDSDYVEVTSPTFEYNTGAQDRFRLDSLQTGSNEKLYEAWFKDGEGREFKVFVQFTPQFGIYWNNREMKPRIAISRDGALIPDLTLPEKVNDLPVYSFGYEGGSVLVNQTDAKSVIIPANYQEVWSVFENCRSMENAYFGNQQIIFKNPTKAFTKLSGSSEPTSNIVFHGQQNSTVYDFYRFKIGAENPQSESAKKYYKFNLTQ